MKKADYIWFNGEMVRWEDAKVHVMSHALHYGTSVFEGIRCYDSHKGPVVFRHREHMQRLHDSAKIYRFPVSQSIDELMEACRDVIRKNNLTSAYIRPLIFVGDVGMGECGRCAGQPTSGAAPHLWSRRNPQVYDPTVVLTTTARR
jgi:branched-chain amino acid aminotransferase